MGRTSDQVRRRKQRLWDEQQGLCWWCNRRMIFGPPAKGKWGRKATIEHLIPLVHGGGLNNPPGTPNTVLACYRCNNKRGSGPPPIRAVDSTAGADSAPPSPQV